MWSGYLYVLPALAFYAVFTLRPIATTVWTSLFRWDGISLATWVGLDNYRQIFSDPLIHAALLHSLSFVAFYALLPTSVGLVLTGLIVRAPIRGLLFFRSALFLPQVLSSVVVAVAWRWIYDFDGPLNALLGAVGLGFLRTAWLGDFNTALPSLGLVGTWVEFGLCLIFFLAGATRIPREQFEAARLDGAGIIREFFAVTVPNLRSELRTVLVLSTIFALRNFDIVWNTTTGGPGTSTTVPSVYIYQNAFLTRQVGHAAALAVLLTVLILLVTGLIIALFGKRRT